MRTIATQRVGGGGGGSIPPESVLLRVDLLECMHPGAQEMAVWKRVERLSFMV